jgi:hypothetical protein
MNVRSAKQFVRRRLDTRNGRDAIMLGSFKVAEDPYQGGWVGEFHVVVSGSDRVALRGALFHPFGAGGNDVDAIEVDDLPTTLVEVLRPDVRVWQPPRAAEPIKVPAKKERAEFYRWLLRLKADERLFRYGCDQYFRPIVKEPRRVLIRPKKRRPYPEWLARSMYGSHHVLCRCRICERQGNQ